MSTGERGLAGLWSRRSREQALFAAGALLILVHTVDDSIALGEIDVMPTVITALALVTAALYPVLGWQVIVGVALFVGVTRLVGGVLHVVSLVNGGGTEPGDYTGFSEALGALCVLAVAAGIVRHRTQRSRSA